MADGAIRPAVIAEEIRKKIFSSEPVKDLKCSNFAFYCQLDSELGFKSGMFCGKPNIEMLNRFLKDPKAMIEELLPRSGGWRY